MDLRARSLLWTGTGSEEGLGAAGKSGGAGAAALLSPELELRLSASALSMEDGGTGEDVSLGMRETLLFSRGEDGGVAKVVVDWDEPELRRETDGPAPGVGNIAGGALLCEVASWGRRCGSIWWWTQRLGRRRRRRGVRRSCTRRDGRDKKSVGCVVGWSWIVRYGRAGGAARACGAACCPWAVPSE